MAGMIINGVKAGRPLYGGKFDISDIWERRTVVLNDSDSVAARTFVAERNVPFSFLLVYQPDSVDGNRLLFELARFNFTNFIVRNFDIVTDEQGGFMRMRVSGFLSYDEALQYARQLHGNANVARLAAKARPVVISDANLELLGTQYSYNDYDKFYEQHFVPLKVSTVRLLAEPAGIEIEPGDELGSDGGEGLYNGGVIEGGLFVDDEPEDGQPDDGGITVMPDAETGTPPAGPQDTGNTFMIDNESQTGQTSTEVPDTQNGTVIIPDPADAPPATPVQKTANEPAKGGKQQGERPSIGSQKAVNEKTEENNLPQDGLIIEFNDGSGGAEDGGNDAPTEDNRQDGFDLEDEYYELDGF